MKEKRPPQIIVAYTHNVSDGGIRVHHLPKPGETIRALDINTGIDCAKGTNVAVAARRAGAEVALVARVPGGDWYIRGQEILAREQINDQFVVCQPGTRKAQGCILIDDEGNNMIVLSGSNQQSIPEAQILEALCTFSEAEYCVTGYEIAEESVRRVLRKAKERGITTLMNPSPVPQHRPDFWNDVDILVLNEVEIAHMLTLAEETPSEDWRRNAQRMRQLYGCKQIVITLGEKGFYSLDDRNVETRGGGIPVRSFDTTGAGDGFLGAMAARLAAGDALGDACRWANVFASYTVQRPGTISSYPTCEEIARLSLEPARQQDP